MARSIWLPMRLNGENLPRAIYMYMTIISNIFLSEIAWAIKAKFYVEPFWEVGASIYKYIVGHKTKMAAMPIW